MEAERSGERASSLFMSFHFFLTPFAAARCKHQVVYDNRSVLHRGRPFAAPDSTPRRLFRVTVAGLPNGERDESPPRVASAPPPSAALAHKLRAAVGVPSQGSVGAARRYYGNFAGASL